MLKKILFCALFPLAIFTGFSAWALTDKIEANETDIFWSRYSDQITSIDDVQVIYSLDGSPDFLLASFSPYGYAITLRETGRISESSMEPDSQNPYKGIAEGYYAGPMNYYYQDANGDFIDLQSGTALGAKGVRQAIDFVADYKRNAQLASMQPSAKSGFIGSDIMVDRYNLIETTPFGDNVDNTCTAVAASILLTYYAQTVDPKFVPVNLMPTAANNDVLHQELLRYFPNRKPQEGIYFSAMTTSLNKYLKDKKALATAHTKKSVASDSNATYIMTTITKNNILNDNPTLLEVPDPVRDNWAFGSHAVVAYGYTPTGEYITHTGWHAPKSSKMNFDEIWVKNLLWLNKVPSQIAKGKSLALGKYININSKDKVTWTSSDTKIATVSAKGSVKAVGTGLVTVTLNNQTTGEETTWLLDCVIPIKGIKFQILSKAEKNMLINSGYVNRTPALTLTVSYAPVSFTQIPNLVWTSSNANVAIVSADGEVIPTGPGKVKITATDPCTNKKASASFSVKYNPTAIRFTLKQKSGNQIVLVDETSKILENKKTYTPTVTFMPTKDINAEIARHIDPNAKKELEWSSSNPAVAKVDKKGKITAVSVGAATITAKTKNGKTASMTVNCVVPVTSVKISPLTDVQKKLTVKADGTGGSTVQLTAEALPANATIRDITWTSSNTNILTVSNSGLVTAKKVGSATITATDAAGKKKASVKLTVTAA